MSTYPRVQPIDPYIEKHFENVEARSRNDRFTYDADCPVCGGERKLAIGFDDDDGRWFASCIKCEAKNSEIGAALGLSNADFAMALHLPDLARYVQLPESWLTETFRLSNRIASIDAPKPGVAIPFFNANGTMHRRQYRQRLRDQVRGDVQVGGKRAKEQRRFSWDLAKNGIIPYNLDRLGGAAAALFVEGASDVWTLTYNGYTSVGIAGQSVASSVSLAHVAKLIEIIVLREPNAAFPENLASALAKANWTGTLKVVDASSFGAKDPSDLWKQARDEAQGDDAVAKRIFRERLDAALATAEPLPLTGTRSSSQNPELLHDLNKILVALEKPAGAILYDNGRGYQICKPSELKTLFANRDDGGLDSPDVISWWLRQPGRRSAGQIVFKPMQDTPDDYNLWTGWPLEPVQGDIVPYWDFLRDVICAGDEERYIYLRKWLAHAVQKPWELPEVALLFHSVEGTGKDVAISWLRPIFGRYMFTVSNVDNIVGTYNDHLSESLLVHANEAVWGGDKKSIGRLKAMISDRTSDVHGKFQKIIQLDNYKRFIFASNAEHPLPIERSTRRFAVFPVSPKRKGDFEYFRTLGELRDHGGVEALFYDLLHENIGDFNPRVRPTSGLSHYKHLSGSLFDQWIEGVLVEAEIRVESKRHEDCYLPWGGLVPKNKIYAAFENFCKSRRGDHLSDVAFWKKMREVGAIFELSSNTKIADDGKRSRAAALVPLAEARASFAAYMGEGANLWAEAQAEPPKPCESCRRNAELDRTGSPF